MIAGMILILAMGLVPGAAAAADVPVPNGYSDTMKWYSRAAEAGDAQAQ